MVAETMKYASWSHPRVALAAVLLCCMAPSADAETSQPPATDLATQPPACDPAQLSFKVDAKNGQFDGMSHSGTLLVLHNLGPARCTVPARPELSFLDAGRNPLAVSPRAVPGMHPGPVMLPVVIPAGATLTSEARWVSSDAYGAGNCVTSGFVALSLARRRLTVPLESHLCGPANQNPSYTVTPLHRDAGNKPRSQ
jgi:hypothetical protein